MSHPASSRSADNRGPWWAGAAGATGGAGPPIERLEVAAYVVPTEEPESDGTAEWDHTTLVVVHAHAAGVTGLGYTYGDLAAADVAARMLAPMVMGRDAMDVGGAWMAMGRQMRNVGRPGIAAGAISAVDTALWDLKARLFGVPLWRCSAPSATRWTRTAAAASRRTP